MEQAKKGHSFITLKEVVGDVNEFAKKDFSENFFSSAKTLMSDQCNT